MTILSAYLSSESKREENIIRLGGTPGRNATSLEAVLYRRYKRLSDKLRTRLWGIAYDAEKQAAKEADNIR